MLVSPFLYAQEDDEQRLREELLNVDSRRSEITGEASPELFAINLNDTAVSLLLSGYWKGSLLGSWGLTKAKLGWGVAPVDAPLLFVQEADFTLSLWIQQRWFIEASFQEDYDVNTYRAGYQGQEGDFIRYIGVGNTGLDFPSFPYLDLGGDSASSFGFYGAAGSGPLSFHTLFRYDAAEREERVFVGGRERTFMALSVANPLRGISFVLPDTNIMELPIVLLEDPDGSMTGGGTRWRMALPSEAVVSAREGLVELAATPKLKVAVYYPNGYGMGAYNVANSFLGDIQQFFPTADLSTYIHCGGTIGAPAIIQFSDFYALVIYERGTFSPFERQSRYMAPVSGSASAALIDSATKEVKSGWELYRLDESPVGAAPLYINEQPESTIYKRDIYSLLRTGDQNPRSPLSRWPLAQTIEGNPWIISMYLSGGQESVQDVELRWTTYSAQSGYTIGKDALPGSIRVLRGGIEDPYWSFDEGSGTIRLQNPAQTNELIRVRYLRRGYDQRNGSIAAGLGAIYDDGGPFSMRGALGIRWNINSDGFSEAGALSAGMAGASAQFSWNYAAFKADVSIGAGIEQPDTTGLYRVAGMEGHETVFDIPESSFLSNPGAPTPLLPNLTRETRAPLVYRNYRETNFAGINSLKPIDADAPIDSSRSDPYPAWDEVFNAKVMVAEFNLDGITAAWAGFQAPLSGEVLAQAGMAFLPFRFYELQGSPVRVFVQFGPLTPKDSSLPENSLLIVERELGADNVVTFTPEERRKLQNATFMRIVITGTAKGRALFAPPVFFGAAFAPLADDGRSVIDLDPQPVSAIEIIDRELERKYPALIQRLHPSGEKQRILLVSWKDIPLDAGQGAGAGGRVGSLPLEQYKTLSFFVKIPASASSGSFDFYAGRGKRSYRQYTETALEAHIPTAELLAQGADSWVKVELRYAGAEPGVYVAERRMTNASLTRNFDALYGSRPDMNEETEDIYIMFFLRPETDSTTLPQDSFSLDEIILEESILAYYVNSGVRFRWREEGAIIRAGSVKLLEDGLFETAVETSARGNPDENTAAFFAGAVNRSQAAVTALGFKLSGELSFSLQETSYEKTAWWSAGHGVSRVIGPLMVSDTFFISPADGLWKHDARVRLGNSVAFHLDAAVKSEKARTERNWRTGIDSPVRNNFPLGISLGAGWRWTEYSGWEQMKDTGNYGAVWGSSWSWLLPDNGAEAGLRAMNGHAEVRYAAKPLGAALKLSAALDTSKPTQRTQHILRVGVEFPWTTSAVSGTFKIERTYERILSFTEDDASGDLAQFQQSLSAAAPFAVETPVFALFNRELPDKLNNSLDGKNSAGGAFEERYILSVRLPQAAGVPALFTPRQVEARVDRNIIRRLETLQDISGAGGSLHFTALNLFGAFGQASRASFYQNDEFRHSLSAAYMQPKYEKASWQIRAEQNILFYGFRGAELQLGDIITALDKGWTVSVQTSWSVPVEQSLLGTVYDAAMRRLLNTSYSPALSTLAAARYDRLRKETLTIELDRSGEAPRYNITAGHESIIRVTGRLNLSAFINLGYTQDEKAETLSFTLEAGTTLRIHF